MPKYGTRVSMIFIRILLRKYPIFNSKSYVLIIPVAHIFFCMELFPLASLDHLKVLHCYGDTAKNNNVDC